jgi:hypothetical protein
MFLDLTVLPQGSFESAIARAARWRQRTPAAQLLTVDVAAARALGIYPMPVPVLAASSQPQPAAPANRR